MKTLDLHGYTTTDAINAIDNFLYRSQENGEKRIRIMTGKGSGTLFKVTTDYLKKGKYPWQLEKQKNGKPNEGVLVVILD